MWPKFVYLVYSLRYCCLYTFNVKNRVAQKWSKWHFFNSIFHWEVTGSVFGPFKTQNKNLQKMPNFCRTGSLSKKGVFILLKGSNWMIFPKIRPRLWNLAIRETLLYKTWFQSAVQTAEDKNFKNFLPSLFDSCRRKNSLQRNFSPNGVKNGDVLFEIYQNPDFRHHHLNVHAFDMSVHRSNDLIFHPGVTKNIKFFTTWTFDCCLQVKV